MKRCKVCTRSYRKGVLAYVASDRGLKGTIVCAECAKGGCLLVALSRAPVCSCGAPANVCGRCSEAEADKAKRGAADAGKLADMIEKKAKAYGAGDVPGEDYSDGIREGLEQAARFLRQGSW